MEAWQFMKRVNVLRNRYDRYGLFIVIRFGRNDCVDVDIRSGEDVISYKWNFMKVDVYDALIAIDELCSKFIKTRYLSL